MGEVTVDKQSTVESNQASMTFYKTQYKTHTPITTVTPAATDANQKECVLQSLSLSCRE